MKQRKTRPKRPEVATDPATWRVFYRVHKPRLYIQIYPPQPKIPQPPQLKAARPDPMRTIARKMEALRRVLADVEPHVLRIAREIARARLFLRPRFRPRKRNRGLRFQEELDAAMEAAEWAFHPQNTS